MIYKTLVHLHATIAFFLLIFVLLRLFFKALQSNLLHKKWVKIPAHAFDGMMILLGLTLWAFNGFVFFDWLILKFVAIIIYILSTFYALKKATNTVQVLLFGAFSLGSVLLIMALAYSKSIFFI